MPGRPRTVRPDVATFLSYLGFFFLEIGMNHRMRFALLHHFFSIGTGRRRPILRLSLESLEGRSLLSASYAQTNLVSDMPGVAAHTDPNLVNAWGISMEPGQPFWIANNGTGTSTLYDGTGAPSPLVVTIPAPTAGATAAPTGTVFNPSNDFNVTSGGLTGASTFIFATEDGTISGWSPGVNATQAILAVNNSNSGAVYKGLALGTNSAGTFLYATNFRNGTIDVFDNSFHQVHLAGSFSDPSIPAGFAPFNVQNISGDLFVTYAMQDAAKHDDVAGPGNGYVDVFDTSGNLLRRFASQGTLDSPWGVTLAPSTFGAFAGDLLVGNFGDGTINAFDPTSGNFLGQLQNQNGQTLAIPGLWGLTFGSGGSGGSADTVYFTAGPNEEQHGLFGSLSPAATSTPTPTPAPSSTPTSTPTPPTTPTPTSPITAQGTAFRFKLGQARSTVVGTFSEPNTKAKNFRVTVDWGDSSAPSAAKVKQLAAGHFTARGMHRYRQSGTFVVQVTIMDSSGNVASASETVTVTGSVHAKRS
jgi:uncharacterized protein (TIGR03118 family)